MRLVHLYTRIKGVKFIFVLFLHPERWQLSSSEKSHSCVCLGAHKGSCGAFFKIIIYRNPIFVRLRKIGFSGARNLSVQFVS